MRQTKLGLIEKPAKVVVAAKVPERGPAEDAAPPGRKRWFESIRSVRIVTARYSNKKILDSGLTPIRITRYPPRFRLPYKPAVLMEFAPASDMLKMDEDRFTAAFGGQLAGLDPEEMAQKIVTLFEKTAPPNGGPGQGLVLLCYEDLRKPGLYCHRQQVAKWLESTYGVKAEELAE